MSKTIIAGNWKMNTTPREAHALVEAILTSLQKQSLSEQSIILCPPFTHLQGMARQLADTPTVTLGAQNCSEYATGAYTGEISVAMLKSLEVSHVIVGHSERRQYFGEKNATLASKINVVLEAGLIPIYCCGESRHMRDIGEEQTFVNTQLEEGLFHLENIMAGKLIIAYEPVWAIGTGHAATLQQIQEMHGAIRKHLAGRFGNEVATTIPLLYGGSVTATCAKEIFSCPDVDGGLIGGASLRAEEFVNIIAQAANT